MTMRFIQIIMMTALSALTVQSFAQTSLSALRNMFSTSSVVIECDYQTQVRNVNVTGNSQIFVQGEMYTMSGNGIRVYCDGTTLWTIDDASGEVVIESCALQGKDYVSSPVLLLAELDKFFKVKSTQSLGAGKDQIVLDAVADCGVKQVDLILTSDGKAVSGKFLLNDGNTLTVKVTSMKKTEEKQKSFFSPQQKFGSDWVVTDLR